MLEAAFKMIHGLFSPSLIKHRVIAYLSLYVWFMDVSSHSHVWWNWKKMFESLLKGPTEGKTSISALNQAGHAGNHVLSISSPYDVCWEENHGTSEEDQLPKGMLRRREFKAWGLTKWMLDQSVLLGIFWRQGFSVLFLQPWLGFLHLVSLKMFIFTSDGGSPFVWWHPCVAREFYTVGFGQDHLSDLAKSHWAVSFWNLACCKECQFKPISFSIVFF